jgi:hypothetical protein
MPGSTQTCDVSFPSGSLHLRYTAAPAYFGEVDTYLTVKSAETNATGRYHWFGRYHVLERPTIWRSIRAGISSTTVENLDMSKKVRNDTKMIGTECTMLHCILSIDATVNDGLYQERIVDTYYIHNMSDNDGIVMPPWGEDKGARLGETFGMTPEAYASADASFIDLTGTVQEADGGLGISFDSDAIQAIFSAEYTHNTCETPDDNFACVFNAIGSAM